jgi:hypothetical protein
MPKNIVIDSMMFLQISLFAYLVAYLALLFISGKKILILDSNIQSSAQLELRQGITTSAGNL